eukprot:5236093-Heterocapsa_arctica.AAC.1
MHAYRVEHNLKWLATLTELEVGRSRLLDIGPSYPNSYTMASHRVRISEFAGVVPTFRTVQ